MSDLVRDLSVLVTGSTDGIGRLTAGALAQAGARVIVHGRDPGKVDRVVAALRAAGGTADGAVADLASLDETARLAREVADRGPLDVVVDNAGVGFGADRTRREVSRDGFELRLAVNYLAPFVLLRELGARGAPRRAIVNVTSIGQAPLDLADLQLERGYDGALAYRRSKLALVMLTFDLAAARPDLPCVCLHPGTLLDTNMVRESFDHSMGPASRGAEASMAVIDAALRGATGQYFDQETPTRANDQAYDEAMRARLREATVALVARFAT
jgi:NAD(P)-dependent dehydrogenase (short-subunit alcohol dehydrogenase family)